MHGLLDYLQHKKSKRRSKDDRRQQIYEELRLAFPTAEIPFKNADSPNPRLLTQLQHTSKSNAQEAASAGACIPVPGYWAHKTPKAFHTEDYYVPHFVAECGLLDTRAEFYSTIDDRKANRAPRLGRMPVNMQAVYDSCEGYRTVLVTDLPYNGTGAFFLKKCRRGIISEQLRRALGDVPAFLSSAIKPSQAVPASKLAGSGSAAAASSHDIFSAPSRTEGYFAVKKRAFAVEDCTHKEDLHNRQGACTDTRTEHEIPGLGLSIARETDSPAPSAALGLDSTRSLADASVATHAPPPKRRDHGSKVRERMKRLKF